MATAIASLPNVQSEMDTDLRKKSKAIFHIRLLRGRHVDRQGPFDEGDTSPSFPKGRYSLRTFQADKLKETYPEFETNIDLTGPAYNSPGRPPKFAKVSDKVEPQIVLLDPTKRQSGETVTAFHARLALLMGEVKAQSDATMKSLDGMNIDQLREFAESEEIDHTAAKNVDELRKQIKSALSGSKPSSK